MFINVYIKSFQLYQFATNIYFNTILPSMPQQPKKSHPFILSHEYASHSPYACYMPYLSPPLWFYHPNTTLQRGQVTKLNMWKPISDNIKVKKEWFKIHFNMVLITIHNVEYSSKYIKVSNKTHPNYNYKYKLILWPTEPTGNTTNTKACCWTVSWVTINHLQSSSSTFLRFTLVFYFLVFQVVASEDIFSTN